MLEDVLEKFQNNPIDFDLEKRSAIQTYAEYISANRQLVPCVGFYGVSDRIAWIRGHAFTDENEHNFQLMQMLMCSSSLKAFSIICTFAYPVKYADGITRESIVTFVASERGSVAEPFPYTVDNGVVSFDDSLEIDSDHLCYPAEINELLATCMKINKTIDKPSKLMRWLSSLNFEVEFANKYNIDNIDVLSYMP